MESFISSILGESVTFKEILPAEGIRLNEQASLVIMDIICLDTKGRIINVEMQKLGYQFPGERACCYSSDMIMRQYNILREQKGKAFKYKDMKPTHLIILMEKSSYEFSKVSPHYIHRSITTYSSGANVTNLSNICYISLDTFKETIQNIDSIRDAWLTFLSTTDISKIMSLINSYPQFFEIYQEIMAFRNNPEEMINMASEMIRTLDHNTIMYMIDELNIKIEEQSAALDKKDAALEEKDATISALQAEIEKLKNAK